jgi:AraC-like DNA-binding protein
MENTYLNFLTSFFSKLNVGYHVTDMNSPLSSDIDLGLRSAITYDAPECLNSFNEIEHDFATSQIIYLTCDRYECHYILMPMLDEAGHIMILGPYLTENSGINRTNDICKRNGIPEGLASFLHQYYATLPCLSDSSVVENLLLTIGENYFDGGSFRIEYIKENTVPETTYTTSADFGAGTDDIMARLEYRYNLEEKVLDAISRGDFNTAMHFSSDQSLRNIDNRSSSTLRSKKNNLLAFNTICRKGAQRGNVHPIHLDEMSRRMAIKIENMTAPDQDKEIHREILRRYCTMVQQNSTSGYSPTMQRVINHIYQHLFEPELTLQSTALDLSLNKSYLATIFKKETGKTFTAYVNSKRLDHAIFLLNTTDLPIQEIAGSCGIADVTYFTRIFKADKGMTPSQYRNMLKG